MHQQGDVILIEIKKIPKDAKRKSNNHLADGEVSGHYHEAQGEGVAVMEADDKLFLSAINGCKVVHQEHKTIEVPAGDYEVRKVQEYDHFLEASRAVRD